MKSYFHERAQQFAVTPDEAQAFNDTHSLSLILAPHSSIKDGLEQASYAREGSLVHVETVHFDESKLNAPFEDFLERDLRGETKHDPTAFSSKVFDILIHQSLAFYKMQQDDPRRFNSYRDRTFDELDANGGFASYNPMSGHKLVLLFGLLEKGALFVPNDASNSQLSVDEGNEIRERRFQPRPEHTREDPIGVYNYLGVAAVDYYDMSRFRDITLAKNLMTFDESLYRSALRVKPDEQLPTHIIRGGGHRNSLTGRLKEYGIDYSIALDRQVGDGHEILDEFGPNAGSDQFHEAYAASQLDAIEPSERTISSVRRFGAELPPREDTAIALGISLADLDKYQTKAATNRRDFTTFTRLNELSRVDVSQLGFWQKRKHVKAIRDYLFIIGQDL